MKPAAEPPRSVSSSPGWQEAGTRRCQKSLARKALGLTIAVAFAASCATGQPGSHRDAAEGTIRPLARYSLPKDSGTTPPTDIRWATNDSVFVARADDGVFEVALGESGKTTTQRHPVPSRSDLGEFFEFSRLAVSARELLASSISLTLAWRPVDLQPSGTVEFQRRTYAVIADLDAQGDKVALLGVPDTDLDQFLRNPGVLWVGSLSKGLNDFRALLRDDTKTGVNGSFVYRCYPLDMGSVRFLPDGSIFTVPGFQPGAYLFDADGRRLRAWTNRELGIDSGCSGVDLEQAKRFFNHPKERQAWFDRSRIVDDVLPLPQGPGLLVRQMGRDGTVRWSLKILTAAGGMVTYDVPLTSRNPFERLRGDVRGGKIVLLRTLDNMSMADQPGFQGEVIVAALPDSTPGMSGPAREGGRMK